MNSTEAPGVLLIAVLCLALGGAICGYFSFGIIAQMHQRAALRKDGRDAAGTVSYVHASHGDTTVGYAFSVNGVNYRGRAQMPQLYYSQPFIFHESDQIAVRYLPSNPAVNHPAAWEWSGSNDLDPNRDLIPNLFAIFFPSMGVIALVWLLRDRKLAREGSAVEGEVTECAPNKKSQFRVEYEFRTPNGVRVRGSCNCLEEYKAGDRIWIIYLLNRPQRNHIYPLLFFEIVE